MLPSLRLSVPLALLCALAAAPLGSVGFTDPPLAFEPNHQPQVTGTVAHMRLEGARDGAPAPGQAYPAPRAT